MGRRRAPGVHSPRGTVASRRPEHEAQHDAGSDECDPTDQDGGDLVAVAVPGEGASGLCGSRFDGSPTVDRDHRRPRSRRPRGRHTSPRDCGPSPGQVCSRGPSRQGGDRVCRSARPRRCRSGASRRAYTLFLRLEVDEPTGDEHGSRPLRPPDDAPGVSGVGDLPSPRVGGASDHPCPDRDAQARVPGQPRREVPGTRHCPVLLLRLPHRLPPQIEAEQREADDRHRL